MYNKLLYLTTKNRDCQPCWKTYSVIVSLRACKKKPISLVCKQNKFKVWNCKILTLFLFYATGSHGWIMNEKWIKSGTQMTRWHVKMFWIHHPAVLYSIIHYSAHCYTDPLQHFKNRLHPRPKLLRIIGIGQPKPLRGKAS